MTHFELIEYGKSDEMSLPRVDGKDCGSHLLDACPSSSLRALALEETDCHVVSSPAERPTWQGAGV